MTLVLSAPEDAGISPGRENVIEVGKLLKMSEAPNGVAMKPILQLHEANSI
jgi:hypothetical protein